MSHSPWQVRITEVETHYSTELPSGRFAFGASTIDGLTLVHVRVRVEDRRGQTAEGWGAVFLSHPWAFPGGDVLPATRDTIMRGIVDAAGSWLTGSGVWGHPLDHFLAIEPELPRLAREVAAVHGVDQVVPPLAALVSLSPVDGAIHDAYGNLFGRSSYDLLTTDAIGWELGRVLGPSFGGTAPADFLRPWPVDRLPIAHTVGAADPVAEGDARDGLIAPLGDWVRQDRVRSFKVKLKGRDLAWDVDRVVSVFRVARSVLTDGPITVFADLNEQAPSVDYVHAWLDGVLTADPDAFAALDAVEQPLSRNLGPDAPSLASVSERLPVVLDEGLTSLQSIDDALGKGWSGIALKTCKTQSLMLLALPVAVRRGLHVSVQDLTHAGIAFIQSAGLAARLPVTRSMEANARQYYPHVSALEMEAWPDLYRLEDGSVGTGSLTGPGLGYDVRRIPRDLFHG